MKWEQELGRFVCRLQGQALGCWLQLLTVLRKGCRQKELT